MGLWAAIGRTAADVRWIGRLGVAVEGPESDPAADPLEAADAEAGDPAWTDSRADRDTASTGRVGSDGAAEGRELPVAETVRCTGASASSPSSSPSPWRWIVVRRLDEARGIGPAIVDRLTTGEDGPVGLPIGRAAGGRLVGAPTPRRVAPGARTGREAAAGSDAVAGVRDGASDDVEAWRLTAGMALRARAGFAGARRIPPDGAGRGAAGACEPSEAGAACEWPAWLRWATGRTTEAAEVSGRSGTRIALRATVGRLRTGAISGAGMLAIPTSSSSPASSAADRDTTGAELLPGLEDLDATGDELGTTGGSAIATGSGSAVVNGSAWPGAAWRWAVALARRWTGAGMEPADGCSTARTRATTSPGVAIGLTSWPSCWTTGGRPCVPGSASTNRPGAATSGIDPAAR
jgi:hypothetical protein